MEISEAVDYARPIKRGALATIKKDGRPQISNVMFAAGDDGIVRISITTGRAKFRNIQRDPRVSLHVTKPDFWSYVVIEADVELMPVASSTDDATVDELVRVYREQAGEHSDWNEYRAAMISDHRLVARLHPTHAYGMVGR